MIKILLTDLSRVLVLPKNTTYTGGLNKLHKTLSGHHPDYDFFDHFLINEALLAFYESLPVPVHILTNGRYIHTHPPVREKLLAVAESILVAQEIGYTKNDQRLYTHVAKQLGTTTESIFFTDDRETNVAAAEQARCTTLRFTSTTQFLKECPQVIR